MEKHEEGLPYTVVGSSTKPIPIQSILLTAEGIKELAKRTKKGDMVRIKMWSDISNEGQKQSHYQRISIIRKSK